MGSAGYRWLYEACGTFAFSVVAVLPGFAGVAVGRRLRVYAPEGMLDAGVVVLLAVVGLRLLAAGFTGG